MPKRRPLLLAMIAAGLLTGEGLSDAVSDDVFVPELAVLDGALCGGAAPAARSPLLLQLAQAKQTEVSPAGAAAAAAAGAAAQTDPPLIPGLGSRSYRVSTSSRPAQRYFDQGLRLAWGFNHAEAQRAFRKAQRLDPDCVFRDSLAKTPNNGWALYGLAQTYARQGLQREARAVEQHLARAWSGERKYLDLARL